MKFVAASDCSLLVVLGEGISVETNARVHRMCHRLQTVDGITSLSPAYSSLLVRFNPFTRTHDQIEGLVRALPGDANEREEARIIEIPVHYDGPDLDDVAERHNLSRAAVAEAHCTTIYHAFFAGFIPGFVYLGEVPSLIATPRRATPRREVPAGSVAIAGTQTGVYPRSTPGGWNLIGRTNAQMFNPEMGEALIEPGNRVRFVPL